MKMTETPATRALAAIVAIDYTGNPSACLAAVQKLTSAGDLEAACVAMGIWSAVDEQRELLKAA